MTINMAEMEPGKGGTSAKTSAGKIKSVHPFPNFFFSRFVLLFRGGGFCSTADVFLWTITLSLRLFISAL